MVKVKAVWKVGYPAGSKKKIYSEGDEFECDKEWASQKEAESKVEIVEKTDDELSVEEMLEKYDEGYGWYKLPGVDRKLRKDEAIEKLKEM